MGKYQADDSYPAGEATPIEITAQTPIPTLPVRKYLANSRTYTNQHQHKESETLRSNTYVPSHPSAQPRRRPCSSWYSQPSISHSSSHSRPFQPTSPSPPVPRLTSTALRSLEQRFAVPEQHPETNYYRRPSGSDPWQHSDDEDEDDNEALSPTSTPVRMATPTRRVSVDAFLSAAKRTAVSEYLRDRTWLPSSPSFAQSQSHSPPLAVGIAVTTTDHVGSSVVYGKRKSTLGRIARQVARKVSLSGSDGSEGQTRKVKNSDNRKSVLTARPVRHRSIVNARPRLLRADAEDLASEYEHDCGSEPAQTVTGGTTLVSVAGEKQERTPSKRSRKPSLTGTISSFAIFGARKSALKELAGTPSVPRLTLNPAGTGSKKSAVVSNDHATKHATPVIGVPYEMSRVGRSPIHITTVRELESNTNSPHSTHQPAQSITPSYHHRPLPQRTTRLTTPTTHRHHQLSTTIFSPPRHRPIAHSEPLKTRTRDPYACSNQGKYLYIGTLRGPTPAGLQSLHDTMERAIVKYGEIEGRRRGCKEVRKWLRYEERGVIEWVLCYVRGYWGVEV